MKNNENEDNCKDKSSDDKKRCLSSHETKLKRKADDEVERIQRRVRFMKMEARNREKLNMSIKSENPISKNLNDNENENENENEDEELDLTLSLAPPGHRPNKTTNNSSSSGSSNSNHNSNFFIGESSTSKSQTKKSLSSCTSSKTWSPSPSTSTALAATNDGWTIKKELSKSDVDGQQGRLLIEKRDVRHIMEGLNEDDKKKVENGGSCPIDVFDEDTGEVYRMKFSHWKSTNSYIIIGGWNVRFALRRGLAEKDVIGLRWDVENKRLVFSVLMKAVVTTTPRDFTN
ncbi:hypothetical protein RND81_03G174500 [Saponaria officinalis]|uniref:TF-B3 domain-containing protein n=1 Tax=Saponaria officinalis TaxID=3572 RepID=A0AAW1M8B3_SAPOF